MVLFSLSRETAYDVGSQLEVWDRGQEDVTDTLEL
jgi:hypothetical protein